MERPVTGGRWTIKVEWQRSKGMGSGPVLGKTVLHSGLMCRRLHNCVTSDRHLSLLTQDLVVSWRSAASRLPTATMLQHQTRRSSPRMFRGTAR